MKVPGSSVFAVLCRMSRPGCDWRGTGGGSQMAGVVTTRPPSLQPETTNTAHTFKFLATLLHIYPNGGHINTFIKL